jgi:hypothetical protein
MDMDETWVVRVHYDDVNTAQSMAYGLHRIIGLPIRDAWKRMAEVQECGSADVGWFDNHMEAEHLVARFLVFGLHATVGQG